MKAIGRFVFAGAIFLSSSFVVATASAQEPFSPSLKYDHPDNVYWGDTHVHTSLSTGDANLAGMNRMPPTVAFRFAKGEAIQSGNGMTAQLSRLLDFLVVADHAENLGTAYSLQNQDPALLETSGISADIVSQHSLKLATIDTMMVEILLASVAS